MLSRSQQSHTRLEHMCGLEIDKPGHKARLTSIIGTIGLHTVMFKIKINLSLEAVNVTTIIKKTDFIIDACFNYVSSLFEVKVFGIYKMKSFSLESERSRPNWCH